LINTCSANNDIGFSSLSYIQVAVLGVIQGISELLPISSTAHMRIVPAILGWRDPGSIFSAVMQLATLGVVVSYFWHSIREVTIGSIKAVVKLNFGSFSSRLGLATIFATIPIGIVGIALMPMLNACNSPLRDLNVIGFACIIMGVLMGIAELNNCHLRNMSEMHLKDALIIGLAQIGALIPGVSRSGSTLTAALFLNFRREEAARFSFLLGLPAITLAGLRELYLLLQLHMQLKVWMLLIFGLAIASISAFCAISGLMFFLERFSTWPFIIYRIFLGIILLVLVHEGLLS